MKTAATPSESPLIMLVHAAIIGIVLYLIMRFALGQKDVVAQTRSTFIALLVALYMLTFGHGLPSGRVNPALLW